MIQQKSLSDHLFRFDNVVINSSSSSAMNKYKDQGVWVQNEYFQYKVRIYV